ncbi:MAG: hypothetical protein CMN87_07360 [Stappia sp.]|jgi:hypothetical protein|uniref:putative signal transducing protein n=1 Tax=Stappia sp. TaxID=1870903 RepID=UPI000C37E99F|nr:DUF2007 domain-containing protein [Stappia sp.]MAB00395.1 hypothetical protein [Stappia sp.]MBM19810.1 hypothetical protein [Stappia sp.]|tara:strand:+ start:764 stop:1030 length:267 start_codon:yes stop_codon:yes gene_type:complete
MVPLLRTNDAVLISFIEALLDESGIRHMVLDGNMSVVEGTLGIIPRRVMIPEDESLAAVRLLRDADLAHEIDPACLKAAGLNADGTPA